MQQTIIQDEVPVHTSEQVVMPTLAHCFGLTQCDLGPQVIYFNADGTPHGVRLAVTTPSPHASAVSAVRVNLICGPVYELGLTSVEVISEATAYQLVLASALTNGGVPSASAPVALPRPLDYSPSYPQALGWLPRRSSSGPQWGWKPPGARARPTITKKPPLTPQERKQDALRVVGAALLLVFIFVFVRFVLLSPLASSTTATDDNGQAASEGAAASQSRSAVTSATTDQSMTNGDKASNKSNNGGGASAPVVVPPTGYYNPLGPATISKEVFREFIAQMGSPALPEADTMYAACIEEGCDPALALAFFEHESSGGKAGVAVYTRSIGNIRCSAGYECYQTGGNGSFRRYPSWTVGVRDWAKLLRFYRDSWKLSTLEQIIPRYAPNADNNNEAAYIAAVKSRVDKLRLRQKQTSS